MLHRNGRIYRVGKKMYPNHDKYEGEFVDGKREGKGCLTYCNGDCYDGEWMNNFFHGHGLFTTHNFTTSISPHHGQRYEGMYEFGLKHGRGLLHAGDGSTYDGYFEDNMRAYASIRIDLRSPVVGFMGRGPYVQFRVTSNQDNGVEARSLEVAKSNLQMAIYTKAGCWEESFMALALSSTRRAGGIEEHTSTERCTALAFVPSPMDLCMKVPF